MASTPTYIMFDMGRGPCRSSPERHRVTGQIMRTKNTITERVNVNYIPALHWAGETGRKTQKEVPTPRGHAHRTEQHDTGRPNSLTNPRDHASVFVSDKSPEQSRLDPLDAFPQWLMKMGKSGDIPVFCRASAECLKKLCCCISDWCPTKYLANTSCRHSYVIVLQRP